MSKGLFCVVFLFLFLFFCFFCFLQDEDENTFFVISKSVSGKENKVALYIEFKGKDLYLVPITAVKGYKPRRKDRAEIVATEIKYLDDLYPWRFDDDFCVDAEPVTLS